MNAIIYTTNTGSTEHYAKLLNLSREMENSKICPVLLEIFIL